MRRGRVKRVLGIRYPGQYSDIELYKYHCRSRERPAGESTGGRSCGDGTHERSMTREIDSSTKSDSSLKLTVPGIDASKVKCWYFLMCFSFLMCPLNIDVQSYIGTTTSPL